MVAKPTSTAFTLIELSIVLVIIGLIVGGVLVGRDLIRAAEVRSQISQIEKYNQAVNAFRGKYEGLPGDLNSINAKIFGLWSYISSPAAGLGDGNGLITSNNVNGVPYCRGEPIIFWIHLTQTKLIGDAISTATIDVAGGITTNSVNNNLPAGAIGKGTRIMAAAPQEGMGGGGNYFVLAGINGLMNPPTSGYLQGSTDNLSPQESFSIDKKIDDGLPLTGSVTAVSSAGDYLPLPGQMALPIATCVSTNNYLLTSTPACSLQFKMQ